MTTLRVLVEVDGTALVDRALEVTGYDVDMYSDYAVKGTTEGGAALVEPSGARHINIFYRENSEVPA